MGHGRSRPSGGLWRWRRLLADDSLLERPGLLRAVAFAAPLDFLGREAGWFVTEVGRQPWVIQGVMRTADAVTPADGVVGMFVAFCLLYALLGATVILLLYRLASDGHPAEASSAADPP